MANDHSLEARRGIVARLRADAGVTALVGNRVYGPKVPANPVHPFIRVGLMVASPFSPSCVSGMDANFNIDCISKADDEAEAALMAKAVIASLNVQDFDLSGNVRTVRLRWRGTTLRYENPLWRAMVQFDLTTQQTDS